MIHVEYDEINDKAKIQIERNSWFNLCRTWIGSSKNCRK